MDVGEVFFGFVEEDRFEGRGGLGCEEEIVLYALEFF